MLHRLSKSVTFFFLWRWLDPKHNLLHRKGQRLHLSNHQRSARSNSGKFRSRQDNISGKIQSKVYIEIRHLPRDVQSNLCITTTLGTKKWSLWTSGHYSEMVVRTSLTVLWCPHLIPNTELFLSYFLINLRTFHQNVALNKMTILDKIGNTLC